MIKKKRYKLDSMIKKEEKKEKVMGSIQTNICQ